MIPNPIPNFNKMDPSIQEKVLIIPSYVQQAALAQQKLIDLDNKFILEGIRDFERNSWTMLLEFLKLQIIRLTWEILTKWNLQQEIHPAITIVRNNDLSVVDIQLAEDFSPWLPKDVIAEAAV